MAYQIKIEYTTGGSENTYDTTEAIDLQWEKLDVAKQNLRRIIEHYKWVTDNDRWRMSNEKPVPQPEWHKEILDDGRSWNGTKNIIMLIKDDGTEMRYGIWWNSVFDHLIAAEIEEIKDDDMRFEV